MQTLYAIATSIVAFAVAHPIITSVIVWPLVTGVLNWVLWEDTPARWDALKLRYPKRAKWIRTLRTIGPHLRKVVVVWRDAAARASLYQLPPEPKPPALPADDPKEPR